jgi:hypothetical protein
MQNCIFNFQQLFIKLALGGSGASLALGLLVGRCDWYAPTLFLRLSPRLLLRENSW